MPHYFFHFSDGARQFTDSSVHEFSGMRAARVHTTSHARELKAALCDYIQDLSTPAARRCAYSDLTLGRARKARCRAA